jgi:hypothetical protein
MALDIGSVLRGGMGVGMDVIFHGRDGRRAPVRNEHPRADKKAIRAAPGAGLLRLLAGRIRRCDERISMKPSALPPTLCF